MSRTTECLERQRAYFASGATRPLKARLDSLRRLKETILQKETEILAALAQDLGKSSAEAYMTEVGFILRELTETIKNLPRPRT